MKVGVYSLVFAFAMSLTGSTWAQEKDAPKPDAKSATKEEKKEGEKSDVTKAEKPAEKPVEPPATAADFPALFKKWNEVDKQLSDLKEQYQLAPSSEEQAVLRLRYQKLVTQSEQLLPKLRSAAEAAFEAKPGKDEGVTKTIIGLMAYDFRKEEYGAVVKRAQKLLEVKVENPAIYSLGGVAAFLSDDYDTAEKFLPLADKANMLDEEGKEYLQELPKTKELWVKEQAIRSKEKESDDLPRVKLETSKGTIVIELFENEAPQTVGNFMHLVQNKKYDGTPFHRVLSGFMAQGGDFEKGDGTGGPGYEIPCECYGENHRLHFQGTLSMAHSGKDTGGSQFFLTFRRTAHLDGKHTAFGRIVEGMDILPKLQRRNPELAGYGAPPLPVPDKILTATVVRKRDHDYAPTKVPAKPEPPKSEPGKKGLDKSIPKSGKATGKS